MEIYHDHPPILLLRGTIVNRTYGAHKTLYVFLFLLTIFGPSYCGPPQYYTSVYSTCFLIVPPPLCSSDAVCSKRLERSGTFQSLTQQGRDTYTSLYYYYFSYHPTMCSICDLQHGSLITFPKEESLRTNKRKPTCTKSTSLPSVTTFGLSTPFLLSLLLPSDYVIFLNPASPYSLLLLGYYGGPY